MATRRPPPPRVTPPRKRATLPAIGVLALLAASLGALAAHRVAVESRQRLDEIAGALDGRAQLALERLRLLELAALDDLARAAAPAATATDGATEPAPASPGAPPSPADLLGAAADRHSLVETPFVLAGGAVLWPAAGSARGYPGAVDNPLEGPPHLRERIERAYSLAARGDIDGALGSVDGILAAPRAPAAARAELELLRASLLERRGATRAEVLGAYDRVVALGRTSDGPDAALLPWTLAARSRRVETLLADADFAGAAPALDLLEELTAPAFLAAVGAPALFHAGRIVESLRRLRDEGRLAPGEEARLAALEDRVARAGAESAFRRELEEDWLPALAAAGDVGAGREADIRRLVRRSGDGPALLVFRHDEGSGRTIGFRADASVVLARLTEFLGSLETDDGPAAIVGEERPAAAPGEHEIEVPLADLPWRLRAAAGEELRRFRVRRHLLYGGLAAAAVLLAGGLVLARLRGLAREVELAEMKSRFVANVSHELKTPLTLIRMFTDLLLLGYTHDREEADRHLEAIARETENLGLLIDNVLDVSRIDAGEKEYHLSPEEVAPLIERVLEGYRPYLERKGFTLEVEVEPGLPLVPLDPLAFTQALRNLLSNAVKYSGGCERREVTVAARRKGARVAVEVADRGAGVPPDDERRIFERFYRATPASGAAREGGHVAGTGIGLAIVAHAVEAHGGEVSARSREGGGSVFSIELPAVEGG